MTPRYFSHRRKYTDRDDKYRALLAQGFDETAARRMADSPDIPQIYGPGVLPGESVETASA